MLVGGGCGGRFGMLVDQFGEGGGKAGMGSKEGAWIGWKRGRWWECRRGCEEWCSRRWWRDGRCY